MRVFTIAYGSEPNADVLQRSPTPRAARRTTATPTTSSRSTGRSPASSDADARSRHARGAAAQAGHQRAGQAAEPDRAGRADRRRHRPGPGGVRDPDRAGLLPVPVRDHVLRQRRGRARGRGGLRRAAQGRPAGAGSGHAGPAHRRAARGGAAHRRGDPLGDRRRRPSLRRRVGRCGRAGRGDADERAPGPADRLHAGRPGRRGAGSARAGAAPGRAAPACRRRRRGRPDRRPDRPARGVAAPGREARPLRGGDAADRRQPRADAHAPGRDERERGGGRPARAGAPVGRAARAHGHAGRTRWPRCSRPTASKSTSGRSDRGPRRPNLGRYAPPDDPDRQHPPRPRRCRSPGGFAPAPETHGGFEVDVVDLAEVALPFMDEPHHPRLQRYEHEHTKAWRRRVAAADAFAFVRPSTTTATTRWSRTRWTSCTTSGAQAAGVRQLRRRVGRHCAAWRR